MRRRPFGPRARRFHSAFTAGRLSSAPRSEALGGPIHYRVLGPVDVLSDDGEPRRPAGPKQRLLLAALLLHAPRTVSADRLIDLLWPRDLPADPAAALQTQVSRLRGFLRDAGGPDALDHEAYGYRLAPDPGALDAGRLEESIAGAGTAPTPEDALAILDEALAIPRGGPYEEFVDHPEFAGEAARLEALVLGARERRVELLLALGRVPDAIAAAERLAREAPLRERPCALLMEALYRGGRQGEALAHYRAFRTRLGEELGLDPSPRLRGLELEILRHERALAPADSDPPTTDALAAEAPDLRIRFMERGSGRLAWATAGAGAPLVSLPAWVSSLAALGAGADPRSALLGRLSRRARLIVYDRIGMGLSTGQGEVSLESDLEDMDRVLDAAGVDQAALLAMSQGGPPALAFAARFPERVSRIALFGTYASGPRAFPRKELRESMLSLVRAHWGIGSRTLADLLVPGAPGDQVEHFARYQRESATPELAARALDAFYAADVTDRLDAVRCPVLILHYRGDRAVPFRGGEDLAARLPDARLVPLDGVAHLPRAEDLDRIAALVEDFLRL
jgi:DNA-binding SARP family transcriptional activator/pimeloyl-ACP methyl ester carboxylesterase